ncbi:hypothetical protein CK203_087478 [Vitis vinifera]|uniref:THIF-type NAD/FAD binding fold domain-containing protein n=1 Tax=Vitis vinifera TaxID=29760 RepID=A0A438EN59_VITVI|nr:hypothetical protein CK203_087478 [Vitis vinifera]
MGKRALVGGQMRLMGRLEGDFEGNKLVLGKYSVHGWLTLEEDSVSWKGGRNGQFGVKEAYNLLITPNDISFPKNCIWVDRVPTKVAFFRLGGYVGEGTSNSLVLSSNRKWTASYVVIIGLGGVGSHAASMLLRSGVGRLLLVDFDQVSSLYSFLFLLAFYCWIYLLVLYLHVMDNSHCPIHRVWNLISLVYGHLSSSSALRHNLGHGNFMEAYTSSVLSSVPDMSFIAELETKVDFKVSSCLSQAIVANLDRERNAKAIVVMPLSSRHHTNTIRHLCLHLATDVAPHKDRVMPLLQDKLSLTDLVALIFALHHCCTIEIASQLSSLPCTPVFKPSLQLQLA